MKSKNLPVRNTPIQPSKLNMFLEQGTRLFNIEMDRWNNLDSKTINLVGFIGIIVSLVSFGFQSIGSIQSPQLQTIAIIFALCIIISTVACFVIALLILIPTRSRMDPNPKVFRKKYYDEKYSYEDTVDILTANIVEAWGDISSVNNQKAEKAVLLTKIVFLTVIFVSLFMITTLYSTVVIS